MKEITTKSTVRVESKRKNKYLVDRYLRKTILCHPVLYFLAGIRIEGRDPGKWLKQINGNTVHIEGYGSVPRAEIVYYHQKLQILESNGFFTDIPQETMIKTKITPLDVQRTIANLKQLVLEVTDNCGFNCSYCGYGKFYNNYDKREKKYMEPGIAKALIDYLCIYLNSSMNLSQQRNTYISFYGGEPLMNFPLIREIVEYVKKLNLKHNRFSFSLTTNAVLLEKHMDFLVEHDFNLFISLDGNEKNNAYRVFHNGKPTYKTILKNIKSLEKAYPNYFKKKVNFQAVLHNKNSVEEIFRYFKTQFDKYPNILPLSTSGIDKNQQEIFWNTYVNIRESLYRAEDYSRIQKEMFINLPTIQEASIFIFQANDFCFSDYNSLFASQKNQHKFPSGTCLPFTQKIFVTVNGKILACERIGQGNPLGYIDAKGITLDFQEIADWYNQWFNRLREQCSSCYNLDQCSQCLYNLDLASEKPICTYHMNMEKYSRYIANFLDFFEKNTPYYNKILKEVVVD